MSLKRRVENIEKKTDKRSRGYVFIVEDKDNPGKAEKEVEELRKTGIWAMVCSEDDMRL